MAWSSPLFVQPERTSTYYERVVFSMCSTRTTNTCFWMSRRRDHYILLALWIQAREQAISTLYIEYQVLQAIYDEGFSGGSSSNPHDSLTLDTNSSYRYNHPGYGAYESGGASMMCMLSSLKETA